MHGAGMVGDLWVLFLYMFSAVLWFYVWLLSTNHAFSFLGDFGQRYRMTAGTLTVGGVAAVLLVIIEVFERHNKDWGLILFGVVPAVLCIVYLRRAQTYRRAR